MKKLLAVLAIVVAPSCFSTPIDYTEKQVEHLYMVRTDRSFAERLECELRAGNQPAAHESAGYFVRKARMYRYSSDPTLYKAELPPPADIYSWVTCPVPMNSIIGAYEWARYELLYQKYPAGPNLSVGRRMEWQLRPSATVPSGIAVSVQMLSWERARLENLRVEPLSNVLRGTIVAIEPGEYKIHLLVTATLK